MQYSIHKEFDPSQVHKTATGWIVRDKENLAKDIVKNIWSPAIYKDGIKSTETVESLDLAVYDIDHGMSIEEATEIIIEEGYACVIGTTRSHTEERPRFRVIIPLERRCKPEYLKATLMPLGRKLKADVTCMEPSRLYFPCKEVVYKRTGRRLPIIEEVFTSEFTKRTPEENMKSYIKNYRKLRTTGVGVDEGDRNNFIHILACDAALCQIPQEVLKQRIMPYTSLPEKEVDVTIASAYRRRSQD